MRWSRPLQQWWGVWPVTQRPCTPAEWSSPAAQTQGRSTPYRARRAFARETPVPITNRPPHMLNLDLAVTASTLDSPTGRVRPARTLRGGQNTGRPLARRPSLGQTQSANHSIYQLGARRCAPISLRCPPRATRVTRATAHRPDNVLSLHYSIWVAVVMIKRAIVVALLTPAVAAALLPRPLLSPPYLPMVCASCASKCPSHRARRARPRRRARALRRVRPRRTPPAAYLWAAPRVVAATSVVDRAILRRNRATPAAVSLPRQALPAGPLQPATRPCGLRAVREPRAVCRRRRQRPPRQTPLYHHGGPTTTARSQLRVDNPEGSTRRGLKAEAVRRCRRSHPLSGRGQNMACYAAKRTRRCHCRGRAATRNRTGRRLPKQSAQRYSDWLVSCTATAVARWWFGLDIGATVLLWAMRGAIQCARGVWEGGWGGTLL